MHRLRFYIEEGRKLASSYVRMASFDFGEVEPCPRSSLRILSKMGGATPGVRVGACTPPRGEATGGAYEL